MTRPPWSKKEPDSATQKFISILIGDGAYQLTLAYGVAADPMDKFNADEKEFEEYNDAIGKKSFSESKSLAMEVFLAQHGDSDNVITVEEKQKFVGTFLYKLHAKCLEILKEFQ